MTTEVMKLVSSQDNILKMSANYVSSFGKQLSDTIDKLFEVLYESNGVGIAAPQVGLSQRIAIVDQSNGSNLSSRYIMINPRIIWSSAETLVEAESCLSFPGVSLDVERSLAIDIEYQGINGQTRTTTFTNYLARIVQHEVDHLNGITILDRKYVKVEETKKTKTRSKKQKAA